MTARSRLCSPGGGSCNTPYPLDSSTCSTSGNAVSTRSGGLISASGTNAMRQPRASALMGLGVTATCARRTSAVVQEGLEVSACTGLVKAPHVERPACGRHRSQAAACELSLEFLNPYPPARDDLPVVFGSVGPAAPVRLAGGEAHAG